MTGSDNRLALDLAYLLFRRGPRIVLVSGLIFGGTLAYNAAYGPSYTATMRVLVTPSAGALAISGGGAEPGTSAAATLVVQDHGQTARNQAELLGDPGLIGKLLPSPQALPHAAAPGLIDRLIVKAGASWRGRAEKLGLIDPANGDERLQARLSHALIVRAIGDTDVIKLDFTWNDRVFAARALNLIVGGYQHSIADTVEGRDALHRAEIRLAGAQAELSAVDAALAKAQDAAGKEGAGADKDAIQARLVSNRAAADGLRLSQELARRKLAATDQSYKSGGWVGGADGQAAAPSKLSEKFADLLKQKAALSSATPQDADAIAAIDHQISQVRDQNYRRIRAQYSAELGAAGEKLTPIEAAITADEGALRARDARQSDIQMLTVARPAKLSALADEKRHVAEARARIDAAWQEVGASRALSQAAVPAEPDFPSPGLLLKFAGASGLAAGLASAAWAERRRRTFDRPADIVRLLGIDVLARLDDLPAVPLR